MKIRIEEGDLKPNYETSAIKTAFTYTMFKYCKTYPTWIQQKYTCFNKVGLFSLLLLSPLLYLLFRDKTLNKTKVSFVCLMQKDGPWIKNPKFHEWWRLSRSS